jgi:hypothetical protein
MLTLVNFTYQDNTNLKETFQLDSKLSKAKIKTESNTKANLKTKVEDNSKLAVSLEKALLSNEAQKNQLATDAESENARRRRRRRNFRRMFGRRRRRNQYSLPRGWTMIKGPGNKCIKFSGGRKRITQGPCNSRREVMWKLIKYARRYIIQNKSGYVLDLYSYGRHNGAHIYAWNRNNKTNQRWSIHHIGGGKYLIKAQPTRKCLDNTGKIGIGIGYHQWTCSRRNRNQWFRFTNLSLGNIRGKNKRTKPKKVGYNKKKNLKFMKGKYTFNLKSGNDFCSTKCSVDSGSKSTVCFNDGVKSCKSCSFKGNKKNAEGKDNEELCRIVCKSIKNQKCNFYPYLNEKKKVINGRLLNRFGRIFVKKYLKKK